MGNTDVVVVTCSGCGGKGTTGKDSHGNNLICHGCGGSGQVVTTVHRR